MLNFFTTSNTFRSTLPVVSNLTAMNIWDGFSMFFIYASLLEFVIVNYIGRKRPRVGRAYNEGGVGGGDAHSSAQLRRRVIENPIRVAKTIDVVSRIIFPTAYFVFLIFFFVKHKAFDERHPSSS